MSVVQEAVNHRKSDLIVRRFQFFMQIIFYLFTGLLLLLFISESIYPILSFSFIQLTSLFILIVLTPIFIHSLFSQHLPTPLQAFQKLFLI